MGASEETPPLDPRLHPLGSRPFFENVQSLNEIAAGILELQRLQKGFVAQQDFEGHRAERFVTQQEFEHYKFTGSAVYQVYSKQAVENAVISLKDEDLKEVAALNLAKGAAEQSKKAYEKLQSAVDCSSTGDNSECIRSYYENNTTGDDYFNVIGLSKLDSLSLMLLQEDRIRNSHLVGSRDTWEEDYTEIYELAKKNFERLEYSSNDWSLAPKYRRFKEGLESLTVGCRKRQLMRVWIDDVKVLGNTDMEEW